ncbi:hypothetical protein [Nocardioides sp. cx-173]|uniref:ApeA N-terminal domain 1-containing protein n=1 Tax=Nocardioides sp. cx-173 TaxID=2898796 RepID=UPI001E287A4F|nr:hypothetical protein [Nocardioides sp. cx-173]MCD4524021.1 hypothetical protein [Nocardioides sp. cx-173]UGB41422.1 hypothetical protein LQ940_18890 [Nocardioides sp. cx-173]
MTSNQWARIRDGVIGTFQPLLAEGLEPANGTIRLNDEHAEVTFMASGDHLDDDLLPQACRAVFGETQAGDVLMLSIAQRSGSWGGLCTARYRSRCLVLDPPAQDIDDDTVVAVQLHYYGLSSWSGERRLNEEPIIEDGKVVGWTAQLRWDAGTTVPLGDGYTLRFSSGHTVTGPYDRRTLTAPLVITIESEERRPIGEHLVRLDAVHALLAVAHKETPLASSGGVRFAHTQDVYCSLWERTMIGLGPPGDLTHEFPHLGLDNIGGIRGVASWVRLVLEDRRAVEPLVRHALSSIQTPESRILSTAAAMEYWVASNARSAPWAKRKTGEDLPSALTRHVDSAWNSWIGDSDQWVKNFWKAYLDLKHFRPNTPDPSTVHALEVSGRWLLTATLLDHCLGSPDASRHLFSKGLGSLGRNVREELWGH